ncbi:DUF4388 domain-containing protein [Desulfogranum japonicum]|uniref:DUF4388 domain-containing protein n=1 Tax=Desulfogranum japonicum TaxID=231447 RepID=UPI000422C84F|nr:DUF4388 domain-containing protein [Desulfogranum japonicum]
MQVNKKKKTIRNAVFIVTQERSCPIYSVGEELKVTNHILRGSSSKPGCLILSQKLVEILTSQVRLSGLPALSENKSRFDCGGCDGLIQFEYKRDKAYATVQMKLLDDAEKLRRKQLLAKYFGVLRSLSLFESLDDDALADLISLLEFKTIPINKAIVKKGDPATYIYVILKGVLGLIAEDGSKIGELGAGELLGDMNLVSGELFSESVHTLSATKVAMLSEKNFKNAIVRYPVIQLFLFKMLVKRAQTLNLRSGNIASGMTGELGEISIVDLLQLMHTAQKTGTVELLLHQGQALVFFNYGEIVHVRFNTLRDKDALFSLLGSNQGHFSYSKGIPDEIREHPPLGDFIGTLMEGLQRLDEEEA